MEEEAGVSGSVEVVVAFLLSVAVVEEVAVEEVPSLVAELLVEELVWVGVVEVF